MFKTLNLLCFILFFFSSCSLSLFKSAENIASEKSPSQLLELEKSLSKNTKLYKKFKRFKQKGIQKPFFISDIQIKKIISKAESFLGAKYKLGGESKRGVDCSGLVFVSFIKSGVKNIPRTAEEIARFGIVIKNTTDLKRGDLVFFTETYRSNKFITHVGIFIGNGRFIHASSSGVMYSSIDDPYYWNSKFVFATRLKLKTHLGNITINN